MKKYVQIRFESRKNSGEKSAKKMIKHNTRQQELSYLRKNFFHNQLENSYFIFSENNENETEKYERFSLKKNDRKNQKRMAFLLEKQLEDEVEKVKKSVKSFRESRHAITIDSVITFSPSLIEDFESGKITQQQFEKKMMENVQKIEEKLGLKPMNMVIHYDEKVPHAHISFSNYADGKSGMSKLKKKFSEAQDIVGEIWGEMGYERGEKGSQNKHLSVREMHEKEKAVESIERVKKEQKMAEIEKAEIVEKLEKRETELSGNIETIEKTLENRENREIELEKNIEKLEKRETELEENREKRIEKVKNTKTRSKTWGKTAQKIVESSKNGFFGIDEGKLLRGVKKGLEIEYRANFDFVETRKKYESMKNEVERLEKELERAEKYEIEQMDGSIEKNKQIRKLEIEKKTLENALQLEKNKDSDIEKQKLEMEQQLEKSSKFIESVGLEKEFLSFSLHEKNTTQISFSSI